MTGSNAKAANGKLLKRALIGGVFGAGTTILLLSVIGDSIRFGDFGTMLAVIAGMSYTLLGVVVGLGVIAPRSGARFLNVADADEIREEKRKLGPSAVACVLIGIVFIALALAPATSTGRLTTLIILAICAGGVVVTTLAGRRHYDELTRQVDTEASALTLNLSMVVLGGWAALSQLGYVGWMSPLTFIASLALLSLAAICWIAGKRGLTTPR